MSWGAAAVIGGSIVSGAIAGKGARDAGRATADAMNAQTEVQRQQLALSKEQWELYKNEAVPMLQDLAKNRTTTDRTAEEVDLAAGDVKNAYAASRGALSRAVNLNPNGGDERTGALLTPSYMDEAGAVSQAVTDARRKERARVEDTNWGRTLQAVSAYQGLPTNASANLQGASASASRAGALAQDRARFESEAIGQGAYGFSNILSNSRRWMNGPPGGSPAAAAYPNPGSFEMNNQGFGADLDPSSAGYGGDFAMKDGGPLTRRGRGAYADGGRIEGPGSGSSDSVHGVMRPGSYVLSADTTRAMGEQKLRQMMEKAGVRPGEGGQDGAGVPVRLSNGEWHMPPEVVRYFGEEHFNKLQQKFHRPTAQDSDGMANGGVIRKRGLPKNVEDAIFQSMPARAIRSRRG